jgi:hypothetical protein
MSVEVAIDDLASTAEGYDFAYVITVSERQHAHIVAVRPRVVGRGQLVVEVGRTTVANAGERPNLTLVYPPVDSGGLSLVVDAVASSGPATGMLTLEATHAVLHRPAP